MDTLDKLTLLLLIALVVVALMFPLSRPQREDDKSAGQKKKRP